MTTAYNLTDTVIWSQNRPSSTSTSVSIIRSIFEDSAIKDLSILIAINVYNHYMSVIDIANQQWASFTTLWHQNNCYWKSLFHWLLDIALVNSYLLFRAIMSKSKHHHDHWKFQEALAKILMIYHEILKHNQIWRSCRIFCAYCRKHESNWQSKHEQQWSFRANITNIRVWFRGSCTQWGCNQCDISLCKIGNCWHLWHENFN